MGVQSTDPCPPKQNDSTASPTAEQFWTVLIVDDEPSVHEITMLALRDFEFVGRRLEFLSAYSAREAIATLNAHRDIALVLLDVVMETDDAGLQVVQHIRHTLKNTSTRIILRTGQPGHAPERRVVVQYDINDYKEKTELTSTKLFTAVYSAMRAYRDICALETNRTGLEAVIAATGAMFRIRDLSEFAQGVLQQLIALLHLSDAVYCQVDGLATALSHGPIEIIAATGRFTHWIGKMLHCLEDASVIEAIQTAYNSKTHVLWNRNLYVAYFKTEQGYENVICVQGVRNAPPRVTGLLDLFLRNVSAAFENIYLHRDLSQEISERREAERRAAILARLPGELPEPVIRVIEDGVISYANTASQPLLDYFQTTVGAALPAPWNQRIRDILAADRRFDIEITQDGRIYEMSFSPVREAGYVNVFGREVTTYRELLKQLEHAAFHDTLTGLANRLHFKRNLEQAVAAAERYHSHVGLLLIDLDHFKQINDIWGHEAGDLVLKEIASRLRRIVRSSDIVARLGGDEFGIVLTRLQSMHEMQVLSERILAELSQPVQSGSRSWSVSCSIGLTAFPEDAGSAENLQRCADLAMYHAKNSGANGFRYYDSEIHSSMRKKTEMELQLRHALGEGGFEVFYQPLVSLGNGQIIGSEALLRLRRPDGVLVMPDQFIQIAEETGLIEPIGRWVLSQVCTDLQGWLNRGLALPSVAVNVSARQLRNRNLPKQIEEIISRAQIPSTAIELEITESMLVGDEDSVFELLGELREIGLMLTIDDFGTGYSSLSYLRRLPVSKLKIDRSFVTDMLASEDAAAITDAILSLGRSLRLRVLAEGIERQSQVDHLRAKGCQEGQGFYFGRPVPRETFERLLQAPPAG